MGLNMLITGANSGFGLLMSRRFAGAGHKVYAGYRNRDRAKALFELKAANLSVEPIELDVRSPELVAHAIEAATSEAPLDVLVNNAGYAVRSSVEDLSDEELRDQFETNVIGALRMIRAVLPGMRARKSGAIVNMSSIAGEVGVPYEAAYAASKHAIDAISEALWYEMLPFGVRVHLIEPGAFPTGFIDNIVTGKRFDAESPHWQYGEQFREGARSFVGSLPGQDPELVADTVLNAITQQPPRLRHRVGADADQLLPAHRSVQFEDFAGSVLEMLSLEHWRDIGSQA